MRWLCCVVLQMGKVHFGVLLGWSVVQSIVLWFMVNQIASNEAAEHRALDLYSCCCIVGYGMVPLLVLSIAVLFTPRWVQQSAEPTAGLMPVLWLGSAAACTCFWLSLEPSAVVGSFCGFRAPAKASMYCCCVTVAGDL